MFHSTMGATSQLRMLRVLTQSLVDQEPPDLDILELAFRVLAKAVHRDLSDVFEVTLLLWTVYGFRIKPHLSASIHS